MSNPYSHHRKPPRKHPWRHQDYRSAEHRTANLDRGEPLPETKPSRKTVRSAAPPKRVHKALANRFVEVVEIATGKVETRMGPMAEWKAEQVERGLLMRINENFFVRSGTDRQLKAEAAARERSDEGAEVEAALTIECHECGARPANHCIRGHGKPRRGVHKARIDAAKKAGLLS